MSAFEEMLTEMLTRRSQGPDPQAMEKAARLLLEAAEALDPQELKLTLASVTLGKSCGQSSLSVLPDDLRVPMRTACVKYYRRLEDLEFAKDEAERKEQDQPGSAAEVQS